MDGFEDVSYLLNKTCGVYMLLFDDIVIYVGKSANIYSRIREHKYKMRRSLDGFKFNKVVIKFCEEEAMSRLESQAIAKFKPTHNKFFPAELLDIKVDLAALGFKAGKITIR